MALDLLASPPGHVGGPGRVLAVRLGLLDESGDPLLTEGLGELAGRVRIGKVTELLVCACACVQTYGKEPTYPITPIELLMRASLRLPSVAMRLSSWKMGATYGLITSAAG